MKNSRRLRIRSSRLIALALTVTLAAGCHLVSPGDPARGGLPNLSAPTFGGLQLWADVAWSDDWRVQRHVWSGHHRLLDPDDIRRAWGSEAYCVSLLPVEEEKHLVILLHGLGRTRFSFEELEERLEADGYRVASLAYPSTRAPLDQHAASVEHVLDRLVEVDRVSFVTHSLGGRVVLRLLEREGEWMDRIDLGRVVQIAPPNRGSRLAAQFARVPMVTCLLGPSFLQVSLPSTEEPPSYLQLGVIAGVRGAPGGWNPLLPEDDDGVVALSETRPDFPHDHLQVTGFHTFLMAHDEVLAATSRFLEQGRFEL